jgi:hypothetical protein
MYKEQAQAEAGLPEGRKEPDVVQMYMRNCRALQNSVRTPCC